MPLTRAYCSENGYSDLATVRTKEGARSARAPHQALGWVAAKLIERTVSFDVRACSRGPPGEALLLDSHASRATRMLQQLLSAQLEPGHCAKWRGLPTVVLWPGRVWSLRELREW